MLRSSGPNGSATASWSAMCSSEPCVWTTPFGRPVLPLVRRMHAGSPGRGCGSAPAPCGREVAHRPGRRSPLAGVRVDVAGDRADRADVLELRAHLRDVEHRVQRHDDAAGAQDAEVRGEVGGLVGADEADAVARPQPAVAQQVARDAAGPLPQLAVAPRSRRRRTPPGGAACARATAPSQSTRVAGSAQRPSGRGVRPTTIVTLARAASTGPSDGQQDPCVVDLEDLVDLGRDPAARAAARDDARPALDEVARAQRREELDHVVGRRTGPRRRPRAARARSRGRRRSPSPWSPRRARRA